MAEIIIPGGGGRDDAGEPPKIHVDSDWKAQAQAERDRLSVESEQKAAEAGAQGPGGLPQASFQTLWSELASQAYVYLGAFPDPNTGQAIVAPEYAKYYIDLLGILESKTKGNLADEESEEFGKVLDELRRLFVKMAGYVSQEMARREAAGESPESPLQ